MVKSISEEFVKRSIIKWLSRDGWTHFEFGASHEHGVDIEARKGCRKIFVETKGGSENRQGNEVKFVYGLGQLVTRMRVVDAPRAFSYALGLPIESSKIALRRVPWKFVKKLCVEVFAVSKDGEVKRYTWPDFQEVQAKKK